MNGQAWQQTEFYTWYYYAYSPQVVIFPSRGVMKMLIEGTSHPVTVQRIR